MKMIKKCDCYTIKCDRCKEYLDDGETQGTPVGFTEDDILSLTYDCDWIEYEGKHYCNLCKDYIEREDE